MSQHIRCRSDSGTIATASSYAYASEAALSESSVADTFLASDDSVAAADNHLGGIHILYVDGHVKWHPMSGVIPGNLVD